MTREQIFRAQHAINAAGLGPVVVDGVWGPRTAAAYAELARESDLGGVGVSMPTPSAPKPWWASEGMLGGLAVMLVGAFGLAKWGIDAGSLTELLSSLATVVAGIASARGRAKATAPIDSTRVLPGVRIGPDGLCAEPMRTGVHAADQSKEPDGFPSGPFFDS
jgi:hypothetical protein